MLFFIRRSFTLILLIISVFTLSSCRSNTSDSQQDSRAGYEQNQNYQADSNAKSHHRNHHHNKHRRQNPDNLAEQTRSDQPARLNQKGAIPAKVYEVLDYVRKNGQPMENYVGGRRFGNFENRLPKNTASGQSIQYQEWDVNPKVQGRNRGTERIIT